MPILRLDADVPGDCSGFDSPARADQLHRVQRLRIHRTASKGRPSGNFAMGSPQAVGGLKMPVKSNLYGNGLKPIREYALLTQRQCAEFLGISRSAVDQYERQALRKIRDGLQRDAATHGSSLRTWLFGE